ncbi:hypothetical protein JCM14450A_21230 [Geobacillus stearothermophilus]
MREQIQQLIRRQEQEIEKLLETKRNTEPDDVLYAKWWYCRSKSLSRNYGRYCEVGE